MDALCHGSVAWPVALSAMIAEKASPAQHVSCATQLAFPGSPFMLLAHAFDPILVLTAIVRELPRDFVWSAWRSHELASIGIELHELPDAELVHSDHRVCRRFLT
jgi:hypothetical protein